jgi:hypothetical protein
MMPASRRSAEEGVATVLDCEPGCEGPLTQARELYGSFLIIFDVGEPLVTGRRPFERAALFAGTPGDEVLDLARQFEVLVGDSLGAVVL